MMRRVVSIKDAHHNNRLLGSLLASSTSTGLPSHELTHTCTAASLMTPSRFYGRGEGGRGRGRGGGNRGGRGGRGSSRGWGRRGGALSGSDDLHRFDPTRNLTFSVKDELDIARGHNIEKEKILTGGLRDPRLSDVIISRRDQARSFAKGTVVTDADPDGKYKPSHRPKRLVMPVDFDNVFGKSRPKRTSAHAMHNEDVIESARDQIPRIPKPHGGGGRAGPAIDEAESRSRSKAYDAASHSAGDSTNAGAGATTSGGTESGFATTSSSYTSSGHGDHRTDKTEGTHTGRYARGALAAGEVPNERTMAECFRFLLDNCKNIGVLKDSAGGYGQGEGVSSALPASSVLRKLHQGGIPVFDPLALPLAHILTAVNTYEKCVLQELATLLTQHADQIKLHSEDTNESVSNASGSDPTTTGIVERLLATAKAVSLGGEGVSRGAANNSRLLSIGTSSSRCTVLPLTDNSGGVVTKNKLSRAEALKLLRGEDIIKSGANNTADLKQEVLPSGGLIAADPKQAYADYLSLYQREQQVYRMWDLLEVTPLNSPNNGAVSQRGKAFAMHYLTHELIHSAFPNCRSRLTQSLMHKYLTSPLAVMNASNELGLTSFTNYETEVGLYRESILLFSTLKHAASSLAKFHRERFLRKNIEANKYERTRKMLKSARNRLQCLPTDPDTLHLRYKWLEDLVFSFIDFIRQGEGDAAAKRVIDHYFAPALARHQYRRAVLEEGIDSLDRVGKLIDNIKTNSANLFNHHGDVGRRSQRPTGMTSGGDNGTNQSASGLLSSFTEEAVANTMDVLRLMRNCIVDVLIMGDGCDGYGNVKATDGIQNQQMMMKRHAQLCEGLVAELAVSREEFVKSTQRMKRKEEVGPSSTTPQYDAILDSSLSMHATLARSIKAFSKIVNNDPRTAEWAEANSNPAALVGTSIPSMATRALDAILKYHPAKESAHTAALVRSSSSGVYGVNPFMLEAGGGGLLLDSQGCDEEVAAVAMQLRLDSLKAAPLIVTPNSPTPGISTPNGAAASCSAVIEPQVAALRTFMGSAFLPPSTVTATANSQISRPLQELQLLLKYSPHVLLGDTASERQVVDIISEDFDTAAAPGARTYSLHFDVRKETGLFEEGGYTIASKGVTLAQQQFYTATLYLYHYDIAEKAKSSLTSPNAEAASPTAVDNNSSNNGQKYTSDTFSDDNMSGDNSTNSEGNTTVPRRIVKRHVLGTAIGINIESATHAATMRVLRRFYYKGGSSNLWRHASVNL